MKHEPYRWRLARQWCLAMRSNFRWVLHLGLGGPQLLFYPVAGVVAVVVYLLFGGDDARQAFALAFLSFLAVLALAAAWLLGAAIWNLVLMPSRLARDDQSTIDARDRRIIELEGHIAELEAESPISPEIADRIELLRRELLKRAHGDLDGVEAFRFLSTDLGRGLCPKEEGSKPNGDYKQIRWDELLRFCGRLNALGLVTVDSSPYTFRGGREDGQMETRETFYLSDMGGALHRALSREDPADKQFETDNEELVELITEGLRLVEYKDVGTYRAPVNDKHRGETKAWRDRCVPFLTRLRGKGDAAGFLADMRSPSGKGDIFDRCCAIQEQVSHLRDVSKWLVERRDDRGNPAR